MVTDFASTAIKEWWHWIMSRIGMTAKKFTARFIKTFCFGESSMRRLIVTLTVVVCAAISSSSASAGLFCKKNDCCSPAPVCCESPAPVCCDSAPACRPKLNLGCKIKGILSNLHSKKSCCDAAPSCGCEAPAPSCCAAPAPCATPAPCAAPAPSCGCEAPACCKPARKHCMKDMFAHIKGKFARKSCCEAAPSCGCEAPAPSCGCN